MQIVRNNQLPNTMRIVLSLSNKILSIKLINFEQKNKITQNTIVQLKRYRSRQPSGHNHHQKLPLIRSTIDEARSLNSPITIHNEPDPLRVKLPRILSILTTALKTIQFNLVQKFILVLSLVVAKLTSTHTHMHVLTRSIKS